MIPVSTLVAGAAFVAIAAFNVVAMLEASRPTCSAKARSRLIALHRIAGYSFVILLCIMVWIMMQRLIGVGLSKMPPHVVVHVALALALVPLVFTKVLIARRYREKHSFLMPLGLIIFAISFVLVSIPLLSEFLRSTTSPSVALEVALALAIALCMLLLGSRLQRFKKASAISSAQTVKGSMTLLLSRITQETHDTKTLRFEVPEERRFPAKPGQFLTFHWLINGQRVSRSYTISSSPTHSDYVEITPKRVENGCVSNFLHDQAKVGLTVEASGPYGKFCFDETVHRSIVLIAAGSGITPMIAIVRYIDDLGLRTPVTLLYCVRTVKDIIFEAELKRLQRSLPKFKCAVSLSQPDDTWRAHRGHLSREFVLEHVADLHTPAFFLCGPKGFMENARQILTAHGVDESQIAQESFGQRPGVGTALRAGETALETGTVEFVRSQKTCAIPPDSTLLETAEANGVQIPFGCRQGQCGTCATRLLRGSVHMDADTVLTPEQKAAGYVLPCVSRAQGTVGLDA